MRTIFAFLILSLPSVALAQAPSIVTTPIGRAQPNLQSVAVDQMKVVADLCDEKCLLRAVVEQLKQLNAQVAAQQAKGDALAAQITTMRFALGQAENALADISDRTVTNYDLLKTISWNGELVCEKELGDIMSGELKSMSPAAASKWLDTTFGKCDRKTSRGRADPDPAFAYSQSNPH